MSPHFWSLDLATRFGLIAAALAAEAAIGYPDAVFRAIRHPIMAIGGLIGRLDQTLNCGRQRRAKGMLALGLVILAVTVPAEFVQFSLLRTEWCWPLLVVLTTPFLAQRGLYTHVRAVALGLRHGGLSGGREAVGHIVGRNPLSLDEAGVVRAAIESLAENFSDGVVAPAFWATAFGLPGIVAYKAINTADSMIGHRTARHEAFGWAAARLDDWVNIPASRLSALWLILAACLHQGATARGAFRAVLRDARKHRSPNAGWPEAAIAGALGLRLAGPRTYGDTRVEDAWMGDGRSEAGIADLDRALALYQTACGIEIVAFIVAWAFIARG